MAKTEVEILEDISKKMDESKDVQIKEISSIKLELKEAKDAAAKNEAEVAKLNTELAAKGATLGDIQTEVKELKAKSGRIGASGTGNRIMDIKQALADVIADKGENLYNETKSGNGIKLEVKTVAAISSANLATDNYISYLSADKGQRPYGQFRFREIPGVSTIPSATDFVQFPRQNTPVGEGSFGRQTTEGVAKAQLDYDWTMIELTLTPLAGYATVSRQSLRNITFLQNYLPKNLMEDLQDTEDADYMNALVAAATGSSTTAGVTATPERIIHFMKNLLKTKFNPGAAAVDPDVWANMLTYRPGTDNPYSLPNVATVDTQGNLRLLGRVVAPVNFLTGGRVVVGDWSKCAVVESEGLNLRQSDSHASQFVANQITFLLERTSKLATFRPDAFITAVLS
jgi:hypothetical protein